MKTLYLDCGMGASGDMLTAALLELTDDPAALVAKLNGLGLPGIEYRAEPAVKCGITGTHIRVLVHGHEEGEKAAGHAHEHHSVKDLAELVATLSLPEEVRADILAVYRLLAEAESAVHGVPVEQIHFHEVGSLDAVADVTAICLLLHTLACDAILASPVHVGCGQVRCAHGLLPVPAPATAWLLRGIPTWGGEIRGELCTPTGAAILRHFVQEFGAQPPMRVEKIGYGCGTKDFPAANCLRAMLGRSGAGERDRIAELRCNLDDMSAEAIGYATQALLSAGALDVFTTPVGMKKNRPGVMLTVLCEAEMRERMAAQMLLHTTTLGVRETLCERYVLRRETETVETPYGAVRTKVSTGYGVTRRKAEFDDLARIARENGLSLAEAESAVQSALARR